MLLDQFKTIFDRPEKVKKLRELILQLAVRGKLVEQDENDEPASVLLERIKEEREKLIKEGKIKKEKPLPEISEDEKLYELPRGWEWVRLTYIIELNDNSIRRGPFGSAIKKDMFIPKGNNTYKVYEQKNAIYKDWRLGRYYISKDKFNELKRFLVEEGDIIISCAGTIGETYLLPKGIEKGIINQALLKIRLNGNIIDNYYFIKMFKALMQNKLNNSAKGSAMKNLSSINFLKTKIVFPLPPLNEQNRIVQKVDSLMKLCDELEEELQRKVKYSSLSSKSVFNSISSCSSVEKLEENFKFIIDNFKELTLGNDGVKELKSAILQLAVQGKLVSQNSLDERAEALLEKIQKEKERLFKEKKIKKEQSLQEIHENEKPYELPQSWKWIRLKKVISDITYGTSKKSDYNIDGVAVLRIPNVSTGILDLEDIKYTNLSESDLRRLSLEKDDLLVIRSNGSADIVGKCILIEEDMPNYCYAGYLIRLRLLKGLVFSKYINMVIKSSLVRNQIEPYLRTTTGVKNINSDEISKLLIPLPPLGEQKRIVEKVDSLMVLCDELEERIEKSKKYSEKLMEVILKDAFM